MYSQRRYLNWRYYKARRRIRHFVYSKLYQDNNRNVRKSVMVAGTARSGTTWLADIIASQVCTRIMFEPFHSKKVTAFKKFHYFQYMRPEERNEALASFCQRVFSGDIRDGWIDRQVERLRPDWRVVKDIRVNLFLKWIHERFPQVPLVFIIRHPCAVVLSRMQLGWATDSDIESFLGQPKLIEDFLADYMEVIEKAKTEEEKHAIIWCVSNMVPLRQFSPGTLNTFFYENLCLQLEVEIPNLFRAVNLEYDGTVFGLAARPSTTTVRESAILANEDRLTYWRNQLTADQTNRILRIVSQFGLEHLYGNSAIPTATA